MSGGLCPEGLLSEGGLSEGGYVLDSCWVRGSYLRGTRRKAGRWLGTGRLSVRGDAGGWLG